MLAAESAKATQRQDLEGHLKSAQAATNEKAAEIKRLEAKLAEVQSQTEKEKAKNDQLEIQDRQRTQELNVLKEKHANLQEKYSHQVSRNIKIFIY